MSSPPPGGPQTPPPQYPPPQQPYPPQYSPQQPYYAPPAAPPPKKSNTVLIVVLVVVVIVVVAVVAVWYAFSLMMRPVTQGYQIKGVSFTIDYPGTNYWFGAGPITACSACPISTSITSPGQYVLSLHNSDTVAHNVTAISVASLQFYLQSASPSPSVAIPVVVNAGATQTFTLTLGPTTFTGDGIVTGTITTT